MTAGTQPWDLITGERIEGILAQGQNVAPARFDEILARAREHRGLTPAEAAVLLHAETPEQTGQLLAAAREVKERIYGKRLVIFAPLYLANTCANNCLYCGFRRDNQAVGRRVLGQAEIAAETRALIAAGHKRLLVLTGEDDRESSLDYLIEGIATIYAAREGDGAIRRINVEVAPLTVEGFRRLAGAGIGTYALFQETYHRPTYARMHPSGPKADYRWRLAAMDRAQTAGLDDLGIGALFGLYDYRFEVIGLLLHAEHLDRKFGVGPHTISVPRLRPAPGATVATAPYPVGDAEFRRLVAVLRLAVPYTGIILTTRESPAIRDELLAYGVSQISAGSRTEPGGYAECDGPAARPVQFSVDDTRPLDEIVRSTAATGYIPSFCTACYRLGRTGEHFMDLAKPGDIHYYCAPNAILTFQEYLLDYASAPTREVGERAIARHLAALADPELRRATEDRLAELTSGRRDVYI